MKRPILWLAVAIAIAGACGGRSSPVGPAGGGDGAYLLRRITGPSSVAPGTSAQYKAFGVRAGAGTEEDVTIHTIWTSAAPDLLRSDGNGQFTALQEGDGGVLATLNGAMQRQSVLVVQDGTFALSGIVSDGAAPLAGARVEVVAGTGTGKSAIAGVQGGFRLYSVAGRITLRTSLAGYLTRDDVLEVGDHQPPVNVTLQSTLAPATISGQWQLTVEAAPDCTMLPDEAMRRTYDATLTQNAALLTVQLSGAQFASDVYWGGGLMDHFRGRVSGDSVSVSLASFQYYGTHYDLGELLSGNRVFAVVGTGTGTAGAATIPITLNGVIHVDKSPECTRPNHKLTFVKRQTSAGWRR